MQKRFAQPFEHGSNSLDSDLSSQLAGRRNSCLLRTNPCRMVVDCNRCNDNINRIFRSVAQGIAGRKHSLRLRGRRYGDDAYALSSKTEDAKFRVAISRANAHAILEGHFETIAKLLPADLLARLLELADNTPVKPVVCVQCRRYAGENDENRRTARQSVRTDTGKHLPFNVLEFKSIEPDDPPEQLGALRPIKLSKFLWATAT